MNNSEAVMSIFFFVILASIVVQMVISIYYRPIRWKGAFLKAARAPLFILAVLAIVQQHTIWAFFFWPLLAIAFATYVEIK